MYQVINDDILKWAKEYDGALFHATLCDAPYHLTITKRFGKPGSAPAKRGVYRRSSAGFMGVSWDGLNDNGKGIAFNPETWAALAQHHYPGAFIMSFAGTRGYHRMACAMEGLLAIAAGELIGWANMLSIAIDTKDWELVKEVEQILRDKAGLENILTKAGLIIHPAIGWVTLQGFPKSTRIDIQCEQELCYCIKDKDGKHWYYKDDNEPIRTEPPFRNEKANTWAGHRYGLQALKPSFEFIAVAQVPYGDRPVDNITTTGAGALNINGNRIPGPGWKWGTQTDIRRGGYGSNRPTDGDVYDQDIESDPRGRWPANLILDESGVEMLDRQSGDRPAGSPVNGTEPSRTGKNTYNGGWERVATESYSDSGGASRMFFQTDWQYEVLEQLNSSDPLIYEPKVSTTEREAGLDEFEARTRNRVNSGGYERDPKFAPTEMKNNHPTLKPIKLTKYLATLLLPPAEYAPRRILVPFSGAGSEMIGAMLAGWESVTGIEESPDYARIAEARLAWWSQWPGWGQTDVDKILAAESQRQDEQQLTLF